MDENFSIALSKLLKNYRFSHGMTIREFAEKLRISHTYLSKLEAGKDPRTGNPISPTIETLTKVSDGMGITLKKLLESCGYEQSSHGLVRVRSFDPSDLNFYVATLMESLKDSNITYNGKIVTDSDLKVIEDILNIGMDIINKKN